MTALPNKSILNGDSTPTTSQFKNAMGQLHDYLSERSDDYLTAVSGTDNIVATANPGIVAYESGQVFSFIANGSNTGAVTININSLGVKNITKNGNASLVAGDISNAQVVYIKYDGTSFQVLNISDTNTAKTNQLQTFSKSQRGTLTVANTASYDLSLTNNFTTTLSAGQTLAFTNLVSGQSGNILFVNGSNYAVAKNSYVKCTSAALSMLSATGTYWVSYICDGTNVYLSVSGALS